MTYLVANSRTQVLSWRGLIKEIHKIKAYFVLLQISKFGVLNSGFKIWDSEFRIRKSEFRIRNCEFLLTFKI